VTLLETNDKLCCLHWVSVRCQNCVVCIKLAFVVENCVVFNELAFTAEIVLFAVNQRLLPKWCWLQWINIRCWNCVVCSESSFAVENYVVCSESTFAVESCVVCSESSFVVENYVVYSESVFAAENYVVCNESMFAIESCVVCSESSFAAENWIVCGMLISATNANLLQTTQFLIVNADSLDTT